jgi:allantoate deiminase
VSAAIGTAQIGRWLDELALVTDVPGEITRLYLAPAHRRAVDLVSGWMQAAGMTTRLDALATLVGRYEGAHDDAPALIIGSHIDSVRNAGRYDGPLGVMLGLALVDELRRTGTRLPFAIEIAAFGDEEGVRFASSLGGSRALAGALDPAIFDERDQDGISRREALMAFGCDPARWREAKARQDALGYLEVHIEQGPVLEAAGLALGVVTAITGVSRGVVQLGGVAGHAGTMPMPMRQDALVAAAEIVLAVERVGSSHPELRATVGQLDVPGGAVNTVPGQVRLTLDARSADDALRLKAVGMIRQEITHIAEARRITAKVTMGEEAMAAPCDSGLMQVLDQAVLAQGQTPFQLVSGAGHDGMALASAMPIAMLFVRCKGGISHNPAEHAAVEDIALALSVLTQAVHNLARTYSSGRPT